MTRRAAAMNNGLITWKAAKAGGAKLAAGVALLLRDWHNFLVLSAIGRRELLVAPGASSLQWNWHLVCSKV